MSQDSKAGADPAFLDVFSSDLACDNLRLFSVIILCCDVIFIQETLNYLLHANSFLPFSFTSLGSFVIITTD